MTSHSPVSNVSNSGAVTATFLPACKATNFRLPQKFWPLFFSQRLDLSAQEVWNFSSPGLWFWYGGEWGEVGSMSAAMELRRGVLGPGAWLVGLTAGPSTGSGILQLRCLASFLSAFLLLWSPPSLRWGDSYIWSIIGFIKAKVIEHIGCILRILVSRFFFF